MIHILFNLKKTFIFPCIDKLIKIKRKILDLEASLGKAA